MNLLILGMHRSGTSVLGRIVTRLGFYPGPEEQLMPPLEENPTGFWERRDIRDINDKILKLHDSSWDCPTKNFPTRSKLPKELSHNIATILSRMESQYPYFVKDPRISLTGNYWFSKYSRFLPILAIRNPIEVAHSLKKRNSLPLELGLALWEKYTISALQVLGRKKYFIYDYNSFISDPNATINNLLNEFKRLNIQVSPVSIKALVSLVDIRLKRNDYRKNASGPYKYYTDLYEKIITRKSIKAPSRKFSVRSARVIELYKTVKKIDLEIDLKNRLNKSSDDLVSVESKLDAASSERNSLVHKVAELTEHNKALSEQLHQSEKAKLDLEQQSSDLRTKLDNSLAEENSLLIRVDDITKRIGTVEKEKTRLLDESLIQIQKLEQNASEKKRLEEHREQLSQSLEKAIQNNAGLKASNKELRQSLEKSTQNNLGLEASNKELHQSLEKTTQNNLGLEASNKRLHQSLEKTTQNNLGLEASNKELHQSLEKTTQNNLGLEASNKELDQALNESNRYSTKIQANCDQLNDQIEVFSKRYRELEVKYLDTSEKLVQQSIVLENLNTKNGLLSVDLSKLNKIVEERVRSLNDLKLENQALTNQYLDSKNELLELRMQLQASKLLNEQLSKSDSFHRSSIKSHLKQIESLERENSKLNEYTVIDSEKRITLENTNRLLQNRILYYQIKDKINGTSLENSKPPYDTIDISDCDTLKRGLLSVFINSYDDFNSLRVFFDSIVTSFLESHFTVRKLIKRIDNLTIEKDDLFSNMKKIEVTNQKLNHEFSIQTETIQSLEKQLNKVLEQAKFEHDKVKAMQKKFYNGKMIHLYYFSRNIFRLKEK